MAPAMTATRDEHGDRPIPRPAADVLRALSKEIVVDWQLPADPDRSN